MDVVIKQKLDRNRNQRTPHGTDSSLVSQFKKKTRFCRSSVVDKVAVAVVERSQLKVKIRVTVHVFTVHRDRKKWPL